jgi:hypothetical protein
METPGNGRPRGREEFVRRFHRLIAKVVLRIATRLGDSSRGTVDDPIQETYLKLSSDNDRIFSRFEHRRHWFGWRRHLPIE